MSCQIDTALICFISYITEGKSSTLHLSIRSCDFLVVISKLSYTEIYWKFVREKGKWSALHRTPTDCDQMLCHKFWKTIWFEALFARNCVCFRASVPWHFFFFWQMPHHLALYVLLDVKNNHFFYVTFINKSFNGNGSSLYQQSPFLSGA